MSGLKLGAGVTGQASSTNANNLITYPGFAVVNAMTSYPFRIGGRTLTAQLNINNLFDKYLLHGQLLKRRRDHLRHGEPRGASLRPRLLADRALSSCARAGRAWNDGLVR